MIKPIQLTNDESLESQHTYYDICPWSYDGRYIVFSSAPAAGEWEEFALNGLACREGSVSVLDVKTKEQREVAHGATYLKHGGAFCLWHPSKHTVYYRKSEDVLGCVDVISGEERLINARVRQLSPDGMEFTTFLRGPHGGGQGEAMGIVGEDGSGSRELVNREQLYDLTPDRDKFRPEDMWLGNAKWRPDSQCILMTMWVYGAPGARRSLYILSRDGSEMRWLTHFEHHHSWTPDGTRILFNDQASLETDGMEGQRMFTVNFDGSDRHVIFDHLVGSHPLMHPDGVRIVDADETGVYVVNLDVNSVERLAEFSRSFKRSHQGTHPHPVWNQDGSELIYNSAESGHSEIYHLAAGAR